MGLVLWYQSHLNIVCFKDNLPFFFFLRMFGHRVLLKLRTRKVYGLFVCSGLFHMD